MPDRYTPPAIVLHWLVALLIFVAFPLGVYMHELPLSPWKLQLYSYHKWIGVTVFALMLTRMGLRLSGSTPPWPAAMTAWERGAARATHVLLYALLLVIPVSGWLWSSALGFQTVWLGLVPLPDLVVRDKALAATFGGLHKLLNFSMIALLTLHVAAALRHHFILRDDVGRRMALWPRR